MNLAYYPKRSLAHSLDPRVKLIFVFIFVVTVLYEQNFLAYSFLGGIVVLPFFFSKLPPLKIIKGFIPFLILVVVTILFHFFLTPGEVVFAFGPLTGTLDGFNRGILFSLRILLIILSTMLLGFTTSPIDFAESFSGFFSRFKSRTAREVPMIMIFVLRFIPLLIREGKRIVTAQRARGGKVRFGREFFTILFPVVNCALKRADQLALALHAKAYEPGSMRTSIREFHFMPIDYLFIGYSLLPIVVVVLID